jgi:hypothetical protein
MSQFSRRVWFLAAAVLAITSAAALALLTSGEVIPSVVRNPISDFVQPGVTVWWLVLGGPFRSAPSSYVKLGYQPTNISMFKAIERPGA